MAKFFRISSVYDDIELREFICRRYAGADLSGLSANEFLAFVRVAMSQETEEKLYQEWIALYPHMILKEIKWMPFREYSDKAQGKHIDMRPAAEIIAEIEAAHRKAKEGGN